MRHRVAIEKPHYIRSTNRHFSVTLGDAQVRRARALMKRWRDAPGRFYDLDTRSCIHFVGEMAKIAGLKVAYPKDMLRRPKKWLDYIDRLNPGMSADPVT